MTIEEYGLSLLQMMENAGRSLAEVAVRRFRPRSVVVLAGKGGNGGGGLTGARRSWSGGPTTPTSLDGPILRVD